MAVAYKRDYQARLDKLRQRRYDDELRKSFFSESFNKKDVPETTKYVYESMKEIDSEYTKNTYIQAERVQNQISKGVPANLIIEFGYQGSVPLKTHIKVHSDLDILVIHKGFFIAEHDSQIVNRYTGNPKEDLKALRENVFTTLSSKFTEADVDNSKGKAVGISGGSLSRKFDILSCSWYDTLVYHTTKAEHERGIYLFDKKVDSCSKDYTFKHMHMVNLKDSNILVNGRYKSLIRFLKTLRADAEPRIDISSFMITSMMYHMSDLEYFESENPSKILVHASKHLNRIVSDENYRSSLYSPNKEEKLFEKSDDKILREIRRLKKELDEVIVDLAMELKKSSYFITETRTYSDPRDLALPEAYSVLESVNKSFY